MIKTISKENAIVAYKGFNNDFSCLDFHYEVGNEYKLDGEVVVCKSGFHACEKPIDVFSYYELSSHTRYAIVELWGDVEYACDKKKLCASCIKIVKELSLKEMITLAIRMEEKDSSLTNEYDECKEKSFASDKNDESILSYIEAASISSSGDRFSLKSCGNYQSVSSSGSYVNIDVCDDSTSVSSSSLHYKIASDGDHSKISGSGYYGNILSIGEYSTIATSGFGTTITSKGGYDNIASLDTSDIFSSGFNSSMYACGGSSTIASIGNAAKISMNSNCGYINSIGGDATIMSSGTNSKIDSSGENALIMCSGERTSVKAKKGSWITLTEWEHKGDKMYPVCVKTEYVDGKRIKADTWYQLEKGKFIEVNV